MTALSGYLMLFAMMFLLVRNKMMTFVIFVTVPVIAAVLLGNGPADIGKMVDSGLGSVWKTAVLFIFSTSYFGIMNNAGMFDPVVNALIKRANNNVVLGADTFYFGVLPCSATPRRALACPSLTSA